MRKILTVEEGLEYLDNYDYPLYKIVEGKFIIVTKIELIEFSDFDKNFTQLISENLGGQKWSDTFSDTQVEYATVIGKLETAMERMDNRNVRLQEELDRAEDYQQKLMETISQISKDIQSSIPEEIEVQFLREYRDFIGGVDEDYQMYVHSFEIFERGNTLHDTIAKESAQGHFCTKEIQIGNYYAQWSYGD